VAVNSKKKGNRGELECVKILTKRFGEGFARVPSSGAWGGGQNRSKRENMSIEQKLTLVADIMTPPNFRFVLEHKNYEAASFWDLFNASSNFNEWTEQVVSDAQFVGKEPLLIMKFSRHQRIIMTQLKIPFIFSWRDVAGRLWNCNYFDVILEEENKWWYNEPDEIT